MKIAVVTGANKGIGYETARQLAEKNIHVIMCARDINNGQKAVESLKVQGLDVEFFKLDMEKSNDFTALSNYISERYGVLDILINNAGIFIESESWSVNTAGDISMNDLHKTMNVNFFAVVELTNTLLPLLRKSAAGRIVNLSSILGSLQYHATPGSNTYNTKTFAYNTSKTALNSYTIHLAHLLKDTNIKVNSAHPGWVATEMGGKMAPMSVSDGAKTTVMLALLDENGPTGSYQHNGKNLPW